MEEDLVSLSGGVEVGPDVVSRYGDATAVAVSGGEGLDCEGGEGSAFRPVTGLKFGHEPGEIAHGQHLNLWREGGELGAKGHLQCLGEGGDGRRELPGDAWLSQRRAQTEQPEPGGGDPAGCQSAEVGWAVADEDVPKEMVVDDNGRHLRGGEIGIVELADESQVVIA